MPARFKHQGKGARAGDWVHISMETSVLSSQEETRGSNQASLRVASGCSDAG